MQNSVSSEDILSNEFLAKYIGKQPEWGFNGLGYVVYKRTYARIKPDGTSEEWHETVARCVRGAQKIGANYSKEEAEKLYDHIFNLRCSFSGRGLWQLGTSTVDEIGMDSLLNCFASETQVLTRQGWKPIGSLAGKEIEIVTENGKWVKAPFKSYGQQKLAKITLKNIGGVEKDVFVTEGHRWFIVNKNGTKSEKITKELQVGDKLPVIKGRCSTQYLCPQGIQHGLVFGDGSCNGYESIIDLIDNTYKYCQKYFSLNRISSVIEEGRHVRYGGLPNYYKNDPDINENESYLLGFLAGWIAADGNVHKNTGVIRLFSADINQLKLAKDIAAVCGIRTSEPLLEREKNPFNGEDSELWSISFYRSDNANLLIIRDDHKESLQECTVNYDNYVTVSAIEETDRHEEVFCAEVPETHSFVIDMNVLTGNCWVTKVSDVEDFIFIFMESLLGGGVGPVISRENIHELPRIKPNVRVRLKNTKDADFIVPDSKEGWADLWRKVLEAYLITGKSFTYSTICIRPNGEPIKRFGGIAPGPKVLIDGTIELCRILESRENKKLRTPDVADMICVGGQVVKSGGVRRTALVLQGDVDDLAFLGLKRWDLGNIPNYRANSNNSLITPYFNYLPEKFWQGYEGNGEPYGLINLRNAKRFGRLGESEFNKFNLVDPTIIGGNPCMEALLSDKECCNLAELFMNRIRSKEEMYECSYLLYKTQKAIAAGQYLFEATNKIVHKHMRLGLGVTGVCQRFNEYKEWCDYTYRHLRAFDQEYSAKNGWPQSIRLTVVKPSGTLSLLSGSTPGGHWGFDEYMIRRVRFSSNDSLLPMLRKAGYKMEAEYGFDGQPNHDITVVDFPAMFEEGTVLTKHKTAIDQLELVKSLQTCWADQAVSVTIYYKPEELDGIKEWLKENYDSSIKTVSFLRHSEHGFRQPPLESINKDAYDKMISKIKPMDFSTSSTNDLEIDTHECAGGACPIK